MIVVPGFQQLAGEALLRGCAITSTANPSLSATYPCDPQSQVKVMGTALYILITGRFPAMQTTIQLRDMMGTPRTIPDTQSFLNIATAIADYVAQLDAIIDGVSAATQLPSQPVNIP